MVQVEQGDDDSHHDDDCPHPEIRQTWWERETGGCVACHLAIRRRHILPLALLSLGVLTSFALCGLLVTATIVKRLALRQLMIGTLLFPLMVFVMIRDWRWQLGRIRWHTPPQDLNHPMRWVGSRWVP